MYVQPLENNMVSVKAIIGAICSFIVPGLGQLFYGKITWAIVWMIAGLCTGGLINVFAAIHVFFLGSK